MCVCDNGRPKGAKRNRENPNSKVFFSFYYHDIAQGIGRERIRERWRNIAGERQRKKGKKGTVTSFFPPFGLKKYCSLTITSAYLSVRAPTA